MRIGFKTFDADRHYLENKFHDTEKEFDSFKRWAYHGYEYDAETGLSDEDFERCRRVMYSDEIRAYDSTDEIANRLLSFVFDGSEMFDVPAVLQSITKEELEELLHTLYQPQYFAMSVVRPL